MKLVDLNPKFYSSIAIKNAGLHFDCPCGCKNRIGVSFKTKNTPKGWNKLGENFDNITLRPSIKIIADCNWHGYLTNGVFKSV